MRAARPLDDDDAERLGAEGFVVLDGWLGRDGALALRDEHASLYARGFFAGSRVGQGAGRHSAPAVRSDQVCWFDAAADEDARDGRRGVRPGPLVTHLLQGLDELRSTLNRSCFLSLRDVECHAACYEPGTRYDAHLDAFAADAKRVISFSHYLNDGWTAADGGALRMHGDTPTDVEPLFDRLVIFQSRRMLHEVLPVARRRFSSTGWMSAS